MDVIEYLVDNSFVEVDNFFKIICEADYDAYIIKNFLTKYGTILSEEIIYETIRKCVDHMSSFGILASHYNVKFTIDGSTFF